LRKIHEIGVEEECYRTLNGDFHVITHTASAAELDHLALAERFSAGITLDKEGRALAPYLQGQMG
jgi:hypothetical protein